MTSKELGRLEAMERARQIQAWEDARGDPDDRIDQAVAFAGGLVLLILVVGVCLAVWWWR